MDEVKYLYRYEAQRYSVVIDAEMEIYGSTAPKLKLRKYPISHITPKGKWIGWNGENGDGLTIHQERDMPTIPKRKLYWHIRSEKQDTSSIAKHVFDVQKKSWS